MDIDIDKPTHAFDARLITEGRASPLVCVEVWLPMDCHEDARIRITGSDPDASGDLPPKEFFGGFSRLVSEVEPSFHFQAEADDVHIRGISTTPGQKLQGIRIEIGHISRLRLKRVFGANPAAVAEPNKGISSLLFRLSALSYGLPHSFPTADYLGNRKVEVLDVRTLKMHLPAGSAEFVLQRHWAWRKGKFARVIAASFPVLELKNSLSFQWRQLEEIQRIGRDACLLLTLAARHLAVIYIMDAATDEQGMEEWANPLNRQRSTTEEEAAGPLIDEEELEDYFSRASARWLALTDEQQDAVRSAVFAIHPFVRASTEGDFLQKFTALEGLATAWFPAAGTLAQKVDALLAAFPPRVVGLWPITAPNKEGLNAIRNHLAHGSGMRGARREALSVGTDHLQVWLEHILLSLLGHSRKKSARDWLSEHVRKQRSDLPRLQAAVRT